MRRIVRWGGRRLVATSRGRAGTSSRGGRRRAFAALAFYLVATVIGGGQLLRVAFFGSRGQWGEAGASLLIAVIVGWLASSIGVRLGIPPRSFASWLFHRGGRGG